jgi:hypothetical protein
MKRPWPVHGSESATRFLDPKRTVPAAKFFRVSLWLSDESQVALPAAGKSPSSICLRVKAPAEDSLLNVRGFSGLLFVVRMFQIGPKQEPVNRREDGIDPQCNQDVTDQNKRPVSKSAGDTISKHLTFREDVNIGHQIVIGAHRTATVLAEPCRWFLWS